MVRLTQPAVGSGMPLDDLQRLLAGEASRGVRYGKEPVHDRARVHERGHLPGSNSTVEAFQRLVVPTEHEQGDPAVGNGSRKKWAVADDPVEIRQRPRRLIETKIAVAPLDERLDVPRVLLENAVQRTDRFLVAPGLVKLEALISRPAVRSASAGDVVSRVSKTVRLTSSGTNVSLMTPSLRSVIPPLSSLYFRL